MSRLVVITSSYPREPGDASGHFVRAEVEALARSGQAVTLIAPGRSVVSADAVEPRLYGGARAFGWPGVLERLRQRPDRALTLARSLLRARRICAELGPVDRVIAHWIVPCAWPIAVACRGPLEVVAHGSDVRLLLALPRAVRRHIVRALLDRGATFRFVSHELRSALIDGGCPELAEVSRVEPCAVWLGDVPERRAARARLGLAEQERLCVVVARLVRGKRVPVALGAASLIPGLRCVVIGDGPERRELERRFEAATFLGRLPRPEALLWMRAADVVLNASRLEGAPSVIREARALGVPVVTTPCGDVALWAESDPDLHVV